MKMKKFKKQNLLVGIFIIIVLLGIIAFILIKNSKQNTEEKKYCTESSRDADVCIEIYEPVCGFPAERTYSNSCFACMDESVEYYILGECLLQ